MGWSGPFPQLSKKRPTADLVSRKVLTPLLGQMAICIIIQTVAWLAVRTEDWYGPLIRLFSVVLCIALNPWGIGFSSSSYTRP